MVPAPRWLTNRGFVICFLIAWLLLAAAGWFLGALW